MRGGKQALVNVLIPELNRSEHRLMRIDAYTHFFPAKYFQTLIDSKVPDIGKRVREVPAIHDLDIAPQA